MPTAQDLLKNSNNFSISTALWLNHVWNKKWKDNITRIHTYITDLFSTLQETKLPRSAWVRLNRLQTGVGRFHSNVYKWGLAPFAVCGWGKEQTPGHIINN